MQTVSLSWQHSGELAAVLVATGGALALVKSPKVRFVGAFLRETAVIGVLYGLWQLCGTLSVTGTQDAFRRGHWIMRFEHDIFLPSEHSAQQVILGHKLIDHAENLYYATMHFTMMFVFLIWLFVRHRDQYRPVRQVMAWTTLGCLLVQLAPVSPPRLTPGSGLIDLAKVDNLSVYQNGSPFDQLSAMPSVHVAWAVFIGYYAWRVSPSRWRYLGVAHAAITIWVVVTTGNHWWLDGIVASLILVTCAWGVYGARTAYHAVDTRLRARFTAGRDAPAEPPDAPVDKEAAPVPG